MLEIRLLGEQRVLAAGTPVETLHSAKALGLLAYLALHAGTPPAPGGALLARLQRGPGADQPASRAASTACRPARRGPQPRRGCQQPLLAGDGALPPRPARLPAGCGRGRGHRGQRHLPDRRCITLLDRLATTLAERVRLAAAIDAPWLAMADRTALGRSLSALERPAPATLLSGHLPVAEGGIATLTALVHNAWCLGPSAGADPQSVEAVAEALG